MKKLLFASAAIFFALSAFAQRDTTMNRIEGDSIGYKPVYPTTTDMQKTDGVTMKDGVVLTVKDGLTTTLEKDITLDNGTRIMSNGTILKSDGSKTLMKEGDLIDMHGEMVPIKEPEKRDK